MRAVLSSGNSIVDAIGKINITGNIVPASWFSKITLNSGRPDTVAIIILSELVYWYRPTANKDKAKGSVLWKKKFRKDLLQKSIGNLAAKFNFSYEQVKLALNRLQDGGYIVKHTKNEVINGRKYGNVLYIEVVPEKIKWLMEEEILMPEEDTGNEIVLIDDPKVIETQGLGNEKPRLDVVKPEPKGLDTLTNTDTTTENKTKDYQSIIDEEDSFMKQIDFPALLIDHPRDADLLNDIVRIAVDVLTSSKKTMKVGGEERPTEYVKDRYRELNIHHIKYVLESMGKQKNEIFNVEAYIKTTLFMAPVTMDQYYEALVRRDMARKVI